MKGIFQATAALLSGAGLALTSCASVKNVGKSSVQMVKQSTTTTASKISSIGRSVTLPNLSISGMLPGSRVKIVEAREDDLQELPTGHERALAYKEEQKKGFWIFRGQAHIEEPTLPEPGTELDGTLLPPKNPLTL